MITTSTIQQQNNMSIMITNPILHEKNCINKAQNDYYNYDSYRPLPSVLTGNNQLFLHDLTLLLIAYWFMFICYASLDFFAFKLCDFIPTRPMPIGSKRTAPELVYFILKITSQARISCHIAVVALIYIERCKAALPKNAIGDQGIYNYIYIFKT
jgi:hypothetical protein